MTNLDKVRNIKSKAISLLSECLTAFKIPESHGVGHALNVMEHCEGAIKSHQSLYLAPDEKRLGELTEISLILAALLHDADDRKYFKEGSDNAERISKSACQDVLTADEIDSVTKDVLEMISYVSTSKNGNSIPSEANIRPYILWPRFSDRLEAIGIIGIVRCWKYNSETNAPLAIESTPRPTDHAKVWEYVTPERFEAYQRSGTSASMFDHYYDKLLQIPAAFTTDVVQNEYLMTAAKTRVKPLLDLCVEYGITSKVPLEKLKQLECLGTC
mmetsp:Transcript_26499/g.32194  ORF Transcript_26499/g.32194 Transcript_26499/m.32194 type:complete len:272 (+) Transcript_26499:199-1014(+)